MSEANAEQAALAAVLDEYRRIVIWKLDGLTREQAIEPRVPSGTSLLGIVKHLVYVERWWLRTVLGKQDLEFPWSEEDPDADWRIEEGESVDAIIDLYNSECALSRDILDGIDSLDAEYQWGDRSDSARSIVLHMIEEIARHVGHMDILREQIDGATGWGPKPE